jgi:predicted nucleic acid-binding protein
MPAEFIDSNVIVYFATADLGRSRRVAELLAGEVFLSVQVLNEVASVCRRKFQLTWEEVAEVSYYLQEAATIVPVDLHTHNGALRLQSRYRLGWYDSVLLSAALQAGCTTFWSEDMQHGQLIEDQLTIRNPFA